MASYSFINPYTPIVNINGVPLPGAKLYFTLEGTNTATNIYADEDLNTPIANPVVADSSGKVAPFFLDANVSYRLRVYTAAQTVGVSTPLKDYDPFKFNFSVDSDDITFTQEGAGAVARPLRDKILEMSVSVEDFRAPGDTTDTAAFLRAVTEAAASGRSVYLPAGQGLGTDGVYLITTYPTSIPSNTTILGGGIGKTVVRPVSAGNSVFFQQSASNAVQDANLTFLDMTLYGYTETAGFNEQVPLISINGIDNLLVERVEFKGFQGDGLTIAAGIVVDDDRENTRITVRDSFFDGINKENRNGISVLSVDNILIDHSYFTRVSKNTMPGAIDFEPNPTSLTSIENVIVRDCTFDDVGGGVGAIAFIIPSDSPVAKDVKILNNTFKNNDSADIAIAMNRTVATTDTDSAILIDGNYGYGGFRPADIFSVRGVTITKSNTFENYLLPIQIGFNTTGSRARDVYCAAQLALVGTAGGSQPGVLIGYGSGVTLDGMLFDRCSGTTSGDAAIQFLNSSTSENVTIRNTRFIPNGSQTAAIVNQGSHTFTPAGNSFTNNVLNGLTSAFTANNQSGTVTLVSGTVTVTAPGVSNASLIFVNRYTDGGTVGCSYTIARTNGTSFSITSKNSAGATATTDTSVVAYSMFPAS